MEFDKNVTVNLMISVDGYYTDFSFTAKDVVHSDQDRRALGLANAAINAYAASVGLGVE